MNIFITGATGFIGGKLALKLAAEGHTVHALHRSTSNVEHLKDNPNIKLFEGDILNKDSLIPAMAGCQQAYHLAAFAKVWAWNPREYFDFNIKGTDNFIQAATEAGVKRMVVTSTAGVFGPSDKDKPVTEEQIRIIDFFNEYESSKHMADERLLNYVRRDGLDIIIVNPTRVYGPGLHSQSNAVTDMIEKYVQGKWRLIPGNGLSIGNYVYIDDVVEGHLLAMQKGKAGEKYILGGENASYLDIFNITADISGKKYRLFKIPMPLMMMFGKLQLLMSKFGICPKITPKWIRRFLHDWVVCCDKAREELGYRVTPLKEGIRKTLADFNNR